MPLLTFFPDSAADFHIVTTAVAAEKERELQLRSFRLFGEEIMQQKVSRFLSNARMKKLAPGVEREFP